MEWLDSPMNTTTASDMPVLGTLVTRDPWIPRRSIEAFFARKDYLDRAFESKRITSRENKERRVYNRAATAMSPIWKALRQTESVGDRKALYAKIEHHVSRALAASPQKQ